MDYVPARHPSVLFGHHFASIAGAAPIIGPVLACAFWGWLPAVIWIVLGSIFIGAVHDFCALMLSARQKGRTVSEVAESLMGLRTKLLFAGFLWLAIILVIAVFAAAAARTLVAKPEVVIPTFGLIPVAVLMGLMMYRWRAGQLLSTGVGLALLVGLIVLGYRVPVSLGGSGQVVWTLVLLAYAYVASVLPVNILLQPRDYLGTFVLFFGLGAGYLGLLLSRPVMHAPAFIGFTAAAGYMWPMLFVTLACGAVSGFHSLVASGTTSKQLASEAHARPIGYGGMILEGVLSLLALLCVSAGLFWAGGAPGTEGLVYPELLKKGWIVAFGAGYSRVTEPLFGGFGMLIAVTMLNTFIITTLDSATRIGRYITEELGGVGPAWVRGRFAATAIVILPATYLALGAWKKIWRLFGASNQLVAALALIVATVYLMSRGKPTKYTFYPAIFMLATTIAALIHQIVFEFLPEGKPLLAGVAVVLLLLACFVVREAGIVGRRFKEAR